MSASYEAVTERERWKAIKCYSGQFITFPHHLNTSVLHSTDTPQEYWCQVPELENFTTAAQRKFLSIPLIEVRDFNTHRYLFIVKFTENL